MGAVGVGGVEWVKGGWRVTNGGMGLCGYWCGRVV